MPFNDYGYFWYSKKQADIRRNPPVDTATKFRNFAILDDGREVEYTLKNDTENHGCTWDDMVFLGHGKYSRSEPL